MTKAPETARITKPRGKPRSARPSGSVDFSDAEDRAITTAALADPDARPVDELFARKPGRPFAEVVKKAVSIRLDPEVIDHFKKDGPGWQSRVNQALRDVAGLKD